jgi:thiol-disulfide isomerase/thioredoxin
MEPYGPSRGHFFRGMTFIAIAALLTCSAASVFAQDSVQGPSDKKSQKSYQQALASLQQRNSGAALWYFRDADKLDHGHCLPCHEQMVKLGLSGKDWKAVEDGAAGLASEVQEPKQQAVAHYYLGMALLHEGIDGHQDDSISRAHGEFAKASSLYPSFSDVAFEDGKALAQLHRDDEAKDQFEKFIATSPNGQFNRWRAEQFVAKPELARANLAPEFTAYLADGKRVTARDLAGKVVLVHFWSTLCDTCPRDLPHLRGIAKKFQNQPFVILSVSVDYNPAVWHSFLDKNDVPGLQCMEGFNGPIAQAFGVGVAFQSSVDKPISGMWETSYGMKQDIPRNFTIDADGILQSEKLSDSLDGRLQDLVARAGQK